ncbi:MAG: hypothetical protein Q9P90_14060 [candidate division KSB1 bacterium]|nr:hypothetical protein [candidate division KSB1 bacterium]
MMKKTGLILSLLSLSMAGAAAQPRLVGEPQRITPAGQAFQQPVWSPDGQWIAVTGPRYNGIYIVRPDGRDFKRISSDAAVGFRMQWSPDGRFLLGRAARWERRRRYNAIKIYDVVTGRAQQVSEERTFMPALPVWAGGNERIVLYANRGLEVFEAPIPVALKKRAPVAVSVVAHGQQSLQIISPEGRVVKSARPVEGRYLKAEVSPDGSRVVFEVIGGHLYVMDIENESLVKLGAGENPVWAPNGEWILCMVTEDDGHRILGSDLWAIRADGGQRVNLTQTPERIEMDPTIAPDGSAMAFSEEHSRAVYVVKIRW